ncbi:hypothetical protein PoB_001452300 [Plakobranchus ocellatus]|uniref:Uncharacterized protein n=1 Tax=Plakobranchus ocellatus TaxID=259542 RepID=A0AAV3Z070_9GAST|nr:hypothetical protein PoB_001452300 [Plakobranchus ocellatus]
MLDSKWRKTHFVMGELCDTKKEEASEGSIVCGASFVPPRCGDDVQTKPGQAEGGGGQGQLTGQGGKHSGAGDGQA